MITVLLGLGNRVSQEELGCCKQFAKQDKKEVVRTEHMVSYETFMKEEYAMS